MADTVIRNSDVEGMSEKSGGVNVGDMERWASVVAGGVLLAKGAANLRSWTGWTLAAVGGGLMYRGLTGHCPVYHAMQMDTHTMDVEGVHVHAAVTINRTAEELYVFWRQLENLPRIMSHLESVAVINDKMSHWVAKAPGGLTVEWDAEIVSETPNQAILWRSTEGAQITNAGSVRFVPAAGDRGTEVHVDMSYHPPAGSVGMAVAKLFGEEPQHQIEDDLRHFKQFMEAGEIATTQGQPSGPSLKRQIKAKMLASAESRQISEKGADKKDEGRKEKRIKTDKTSVSGMEKGGPA